MFQNNSYLYHFDFDSLTPEQLNQTFAIVYGMARNSRSCTLYTEYCHLKCDKTGNGWRNTKECRAALRDNGIYSGERYGTTHKIVVKKLSELIPIIKGEVKLRGIFVPDNFWNITAKYFAD